MIKILRKQSGLSIFELVLVLILLSILIVKTVPHVSEFVSESHVVQEKAHVSAIRVGLKIYWANHIFKTKGEGIYPDELDNVFDGACNVIPNPCFSEILDLIGLIDANRYWIKTDRWVYQNTKSGHIYVYNSVEGTFLCANC